MLKKIIINDVQLYIEDQGEGTAILTLHGGPGLGSRHGDAHTFGTFASEGFRVVSFDQRGNGESGSMEPYTHEQFIDDAEQIRQTLGLGKIFIAGGSYGGHLALEYALKYPQNLLGIILRDTAASNSYQYTSKERAMQSGLPGMSEEMLDRLFGGLVKSDEEFKDMYRTIMPLYTVEEFTPEQLEEQLNQITFRHDTHNWAFSRNQPQFNLVPRLHTIKTPTLILCGRHDWITPLEASEEINRELPHSRLVVFENSGHSPQKEEKEKFLSEVRTFITTISALFH